MLDTDYCHVLSRSVRYPMPAIKQHLDAMGAVKMNVMHWHVVDSQARAARALAMC